MADYVVPSILFGLFALFSAAGAYLITVQVRSRSAAIVAALLILFFFAALFLALLALLPRGTLPTS